MAITHGYVTAEDLRRWLRVNDVADESEMDVAIEASSRLIDRWCGRRFFLDTEATAQTYYTDTCYVPGVLMVDDFDPATAPVVKTDTAGDGTFATTWTVGTDYQLEPLNPGNVESEPQNQIRLLGHRSVPISFWGRPQVQVTAKWGWPAVPAAVEQACKIEAARIYRRRVSPEGIASGFQDFGPVRVSSIMDPDVKALLTPYRLPIGIG